jgi:hypothetical protein
MPNFKKCYKVIAIKNSMVWHKNKHEDQWNRIEDHTTISNLFLTKELKYI